MENRDRDKMSKNDVNRDTSNIGKDKNDSESSFDQGIGRSESWDREPGRKNGSDSSLGDESDVSDSRSGGSSSELEH